jgi:predicted GTPase
LQDVLSVAIDLYSGRFEIAVDELPATSRTADEDKKRVAAPLEPLRLCLIGQVSAGKSSIVNALKGAMAAEVDQLPTTNAVTVYECHAEGETVLHLVDLPGIDGSLHTHELLLRELTRSDLVLWVLKANQPAKQLDVALKQSVDDFYREQKNRSRKKPTIIGVVNQVDRLNPVAEWHPPYDLTINNSAKVRIMNNAVCYNQEQLSLATMIPLCVAEHKPHFNVATLLHHIDTHYAAAMQTQLNRRQREATDGVDPVKQLKRLGKSVHSLFKM